MVFFAGCPSRMSSDDKADGNPELQVRALSRGLQIGKVLLCLHTKKSYSTVRYSYMATVLAWWALRHSCSFS